MEVIVRGMEFVNFVPLPCNVLGFCDGRDIRDLLAESIFDSSINIAA